jgi:D-alanine-D-alanine ligase
MANPFFRNVSCRKYSMSLIKNRIDLPILMLHNVNPMWLCSEIDEALIGAEEIESALRELGHPTIDVPVYDADLFKRLSDFDPTKFIILNWCEELPGVPRSEAIVAQTLAALNFTYTGSTPEVLAMSWDKHKVKQLLCQHGIPTPRWQIYSSPNPNGWKCFPAIVKPVQEHCSAGISSASVVQCPDELVDRIATILEAFHQPVLVEEFIDGREFHVSLWGNSDSSGVQMLPPAEMDFTELESIRDRLCTFDSKHRRGSRHYEQIHVQVPALLDKVEMQRLEWTAMVVYQVFGCRDYARLDIRLRNAIFYVLDVNPNPDICLETSITQSAESVGYSYGEMISRLVNLAAFRHPIFGPQK